MRIERIWISGTAEMVCGPALEDGPLRTLRRLSTRRAGRGWRILYAVPADKIVALVQEMLFWDDDGVDPEIRAAARRLRPEAQRIAKLYQIKTT